MPKKYLKGFSKFKMFPIIDDTVEKYSVGTGVSIPYVQSLSKDMETSEETIYADDEVYDIDKTVNGEKFTLTLAELPNDLRAKLEGGKYDETTKEYSFATTDNAPEFACTYRGLLSDGTYRMYRQYRCKVSTVKVDLNTKGDNKGNSYTIEGMFMSRACDSKLRVMKDTEEGNAELTWLDTIPSVPVIPEGE